MIDRPKKSIHNRVSTDNNNNKGDLDHLSIDKWAYYSYHKLIIFTLFQAL